MSDCPEETNQHESDERLVRLVPDAEFEDLRAEHEQLSETIEALEAENRLLRLEVATLERKLEQKDRNRQQIIENYERILEQRECEDDSATGRAGRFTDVLFGRSDRE